MKKVEEEFIEHLAAGIRRLGLDSASSRLFGMIYIEPGEICIDDLATKSGYSLATVSIKVRILERVGLIERKKHPGTKKIFCYREKNMISFMKRKADDIYSHEIIPTRELLPELIKKGENARSEREKKQLKIMKDHLRQMKSIEKIFRQLNEDIEKLEREERA
jgi:DNA-binding transcriptional regulator GbsR (MarR family)